MQFLRIRLRQTPVQFCLSCFVIACHLFFFARLSFSSKETRPKKQAHRIVVTTKKTASPAIRTKTPSKKPVARTPKPQATSPAPKTQPKPQPMATPAPMPTKTVVAKSTATKTASAKPVTAVKSAKKIQPPSETKHSSSSKKSSSPISPDLVQQLQESIAKIEKKPDKYRSEEKFVLPQKLSSLSVPDNVAHAADSTHDFLTGIKEELVEHLHLALHLPDFGEVKIELGLDEKGSVQKVKVIKAASQKNREYLEKELPRMSFSHMPLHRLSAKERLFIISFHNEL